jgi:hypothetical protein
MSKFLLRTARLSPLGHTVERSKVVVISRFTDRHSVQAAGAGKCVRCGCRCVGHCRRS